MTNFYHVNIQTALLNCSMGTAHWAVIRGMYVGYCSGCSYSLELFPLFNYSRELKKLNPEWVLCNFLFLCFSSTTANQSLESFIFADVI